MQIKRHPILNIWVDELDMKTALQKVEQMLDNGRRAHTVLAVNPEKELSVPKHAALHDMFRNADLLIPDGIGMVLAARFLHSARMSRVPGCDLMQNICQLAAYKGYPVFVYGAKEEINRKALKTMREKYPDLVIAGSTHGYVPPEQMPALIEDINQSGAIILFVALGSPRQEMWMLEHIGKLEQIRLCQGIGGTLDILSGNTQRAPAVYCRFGLEWLYRLLKEPKRLKRQSYYPVFMFKLVYQRFSGFLARSR